MYISELRLKNFRCFKSLNLELNSRIVLLTGQNGIGKTSILEALHYICYFRSFKTHIIKELASYDSSAGFSVLTNLSTDSDLDTLQVTFDGNSRNVKLNQKPVQSYKELYNVYKTITITEDDLLIVQGSPIIRRSFMDQISILIDPINASLLKRYKQILENRNALFNNGKFDFESYHLWTSQFFLISTKIQKQREQLLLEIQNEVSSLINILKYDLSISLSYQYSKPYSSINQLESVEDFLNKYPNLLNNESMQKRTLFGAHLDDFKVTFQHKSSKIYASRGQQKFIVFLLKLAQIKYLNKIGHSNNVILLIDDFVTDLDDKKIGELMPLLINTASQIIITSPTNKNSLESLLENYNAQIIRLDKLI